MLICAVNNNITMLISAVNYYGQYSRKQYCCNEFFHWLFKLGTNKVHCTHDKSYDTLSSLFSQMLDAPVPIWAKKENGWITSVTRILCTITFSCCCSLASREEWPATGSVTAAVAAVTASSPLIPSSHGLATAHVSSRQIWTSYPWAKRDVTFMHTSFVC